MHLHVNGSWTSGFLDPTVPPDHERLVVVRQIALRPVDDQFFVRGRDPRMLLQYLRRLGPRRVWRKVRSRESERHRNDSWLSIGIGTTADGTTVAFIDPNGAAAAERVVVHRDLVVECDPSTLGPTGHAVADPGRELPALADPGIRRALDDLAGWHPMSGTAPRVDAGLMTAVVTLATGPDPGGAERLPPPPPPSEVSERSAPPAAASTDPTAFTCFGLGQYAKTQILPGLEGRLTLEAVHEIDPRQIGPEEGRRAVRWDTLPTVRPDENVRNAVVAGFHHTHAPLAVELLDRGARHVVVEKPIATSEDQLDALLAAMDRHPDARVHVSFQRRHTAVNDRLRTDLGAGPISMAAVVYEVPLPERHWYRWDIVGNEVVSNGCHWIDHFLHLNDYAEPVALHGTRLTSQVLLGIELSNGASASISLRHGGAPRLGVREHVTFWNGDRSATLEDSARYRAEAGFSAGPERRSHPYQSLEAMYHDVAEAIVRDGLGDSRRSIDVSARTTLTLARLVDESRRPGPA